MPHFQKGLIALDIDGTITSYPQEIPSQTLQWFETLHREGWGFIFLTGRPFQWSARTLKPLSFLYFLAVQNGALLLEMPSQRIVFQNSLTKESLPAVDEVCRKFKTHYIIYSGFENGDWCYYCPKQIPSKILSYGLKRADILEEKWKSLNSFSEVPVSSFSSLKFFAEEALAYPLSQAIEQQANLHAPVNSDPYNRNFFVIQATHPQATKGGVLKEFSLRLNLKTAVQDAKAMQDLASSTAVFRLNGIPIIAAGDDENDHTLLDEADIKIAMANSPKNLIAKADIIAPPATEQGIITGLQEAIQLLKIKGRI